MRSNLVHSANKQLNNRFMLCSMTAVAARQMHRAGVHFGQCINDALTHIAKEPASREDDAAKPETPASVVS